MKHRLLSLSLFTAFASAAFGADPAFRDLMRAPDAVTVVTESGTVEMTRDGDGFKNAGVTLATKRNAEGLAVSVTAPGVALKRLVLRWKGKCAVDGRKFLGDAWERAYGDLEWKPADGKRELPWYFLVSDGKRTHGFGVKVRPGAACGWKADADATTLELDVRNGGAGVLLGDRRLEACTVVEREGRSGETPFAAAREFCRVMCPQPRLPKEPVYGFNDWYCDYGINTAQSVRDYTDFLMRLAPKTGAKPFMVIDDGWQPGRAGNGGGSSWETNNAHFAPSMPAIVADIHARGARAGIWVRLLQSEAGHPDGWRLPTNKVALDPSVPEVRARIRETVARIRSWGFELIKHDFSTGDVFGRWQNAGPEEKASWHFADRTRTSAEIMRGYYEDVRAGAGDDTLVMGCATIGHLSAGLFELSRIGDDVSGREWARTRKMGVNCLAFRAPQHGVFFSADADCVGLTQAEQIPWKYNAQWLDLVARSGTPLFISIKKGAITPEQEKEVAAALASAAKPQPTGEPLNWMETRLPTRWKLMGEEKSYDWGK
jgi:alpha-galactosidase